MNPIVKNILAVIVGLIIGSIVNMVLIMAGPHVIPPPEGTDITTMEGLKASMHLMEPKHFLFPFLAHAIGTLAGAWITALIAANHKMKLAILIGLLFLAGGIINVMTLPSPLWFTGADLIVAYIPFAYIGGKLVTKNEL